MQLTACPTCGQPSPTRYRSCGACGSRLERTADAPELRRFVTVVTSDLKGSTALGERLDPESLREVLSRYFDEMRLVFESHGGTIEKIIGDAIIAVFGLPNAAEDDALRAVEAAAESQQVLATLNDQLERTWGVRLVNRTGICSDDVVVGEEEGGQHVLTGPGVTTAGVMEQNAPPLEVLLDSSTYGLVREHVTAEAYGPVQPKSGNATYDAFHLIAVAARRPTTDMAEAMPGGANVCPRCGEVNEPTFRFCGMCGTNLARTAPARESRKTVTLVFADPKPTSTSGEPPSPEALRDVMSRYFEAMRRALDRHGATVEKFIGDAVMAVFGLPIRHEDDAIRAIRAAAEMQAALPALNDELRAAWGVEIRNHIGVNTGEVIAGDASLGQRLVTGDAVNTAARLEQAAGAGEIIVGGLTYRLARDQVDVEAIPPLTLKGKAEPVPAYRLVGVRERAVERASETTPFVGREAEMGRLAAALSEAQTDRRPRLVTVIGDAGVGKSRLIREFATRAGPNARVVRGRCLPYGDGITFWPISEIVRGAADIGADDAPSTAIRKIRRLLVGAGETAGAEAAAVVDRVAAAIGLSRAQFQVAELFWGIRKLLELLATERPLVAIVDDIHSAEPTLLDLFDHLLETVDQTAILLLCSARHELLDKHADWSEAHADRQIVLEPLSEGDAGRMIEQLLGEAGLDEVIRTRIVGAAEGNPLFVEQMVSMLVDDGLLRREGDRWVAVAQGGAIVVPPTIHALLAARLDNLASDERGVVEPASVVGLLFARTAVEELVEDPLRPVVPDQLLSLTRKQFVRPEAADGEPAYRFGHQLIRDTAYGSLLKRERASLHERFVTWAERVNRERGRETEFEEILGYHLEQAYRYRSELGPIDDDGRIIGERAATKLASAGRRAAGRADVPAAVSLLRRSTMLLPELDPRRLELLSELAEAQVELADFAAAATAAATARDGAVAIGDERLQARAQLANVAIGLLSPDVVHLEGDPAELVGEALAALEEAGDDAGLARGWRVLVLLHSTAGRYDHASQAAERMIDHAQRAGDQRLVARGASGYASTAVFGSQPVGTVIVECERLLTLVHGDRKAEAWIAQELAQLHAMQGHFERARELYRQGQQALRELGPSVSAMTTSIRSSRVEVLAGDLATAEAELRRDAADLETIGETYYRSTVTITLARVVLAQGRIEEADEYCRITEGLADPDDVDSQILLRSTRARILARRSSDAKAVQLVGEAVAKSAETADLLLRADVLVDQSDVLRDLGRHDASRAPLLEALTLYEQKGDEISAGRVRGRLEDLAAVV